MNIAIVSNINNQIGLQREYELLRDFLKDLGHTVDGIQYDDPVIAGLESVQSAYDIAIFLEVVPRNLLGLSERRWAFLNPEWTTPQMIEHVDRNFEKIFAKTMEAQRIFEQLFPGRVHYTGFLTRDQYDANVPRVPVFLHLAGNSTLRGTEAVLDAWRWKKNGKQLAANLIAVGTAKFNRDGLQGPSDRVMFFDRVDEAELRRLQNMCAFHLLPSGTEGFGHALHEALSVGAVVITNNAPPMSEILSRPLKSEKAGRYNLADIYQTTALEIYENVEALENEVPSDSVRDFIRQSFLKDNEFFAKEMSEHLGSSAKKISLTRSRIDGKKSIAFLGNFEASESTENMVKWALEERLGYRVETLQENKTDLHQLRDATDWNDLLLWIRTPGWLRVGDKDMLALLDDLQKRRIPSISVHLDKFWGIPEREKLIGVQPFWLTSHVWTADGSREKDFRDRGVNHHWMRPAVSEVYCHPGTPRDHFRCDVGFVGAKDYHGEYPFRRKLVEWLEETYGERFKHITNVRGHDLNDFYASCKVVVGDCIFAGTPRYWSDRLPETCGRHGLLLHPLVKGLENHPVPKYEPQNLDSLQIALEYLIDNESAAARDQFKVRAVKYTMAHDTWTSRMREILGGIL